MREVHRITLGGISDTKKMKAIEVISAALVAQYHKNVLVLQDGHASDAAIDAIPTSISVFLICSDKNERAEEKPNVPEIVFKVGDIVKPKDGAFFIDVSSGAKSVTAVVVCEAPLCLCFLGQDNFVFSYSVASSLDFIDSEVKDVADKMVEEFKLWSEK